MRYSSIFKYLAGILLFVVNQDLHSQTVTGPKCVVADGVTVYNYQIGNWNYNNEVLYINLVGGREVNGMYGGSVYNVGDAPITIQVVFTSASSATIQIDVEAQMEDPQYPGTYTQQPVGSAELLINQNTLVKDVIENEQNINYSHNSVPVTLTTNNSPGEYQYTYSWEQGDNYFGPFLPTGVTTPQTNVGLYRQSQFVRRKVTQTCGGYSVASNVVKIAWENNGWENINYTSETEIRKAGNTSFTDADDASLADKSIAKTYYDGLSRPIQKVMPHMVDVQPYPNNLLGYGDIVQLFEYDGFGRQTKQFLPYTTTDDNGKFKTNGQNNLLQYYVSNYNESSPFNQVTYEQNPLNRVSNIKSSGTAWASGLGNSSSFDINNDDDNIKIFGIGYNSGDIPALLGNYAAGDLAKTVQKDENNKSLINYFDKSGHLILSKTEAADLHADSYDNWICTYNVYDDFGRLRYVFQPEAVKWLASNAWSFSANESTGVLQQLCFCYEYDEKGRMIRKKEPGVDDLLMVYDSRDRIVFTQDGNQRAKTPHQWTAYLFDELDRTVMEVLYNTSKTKDELAGSARSAISINPVNSVIPGDAIKDLIVNKRKDGINLYQAENTITFSPNGKLDFQTVGIDEFTTKIAPGIFNTPTTANVVLFRSPVSASELNDPSVTSIIKYFFYDNYDFSGAKEFYTNLNNTIVYPTEGDPIVPSKRVLGLLTGTKVRILGTNTFLSNTFFIDEKQRPIQFLEENIKQGVDIITNQYRFDGILLSTQLTHSAVNSGYDNYPFLTKYIYDWKNKLTSIVKYSGDGNTYTSQPPRKPLSSYTYDDLGRIATKKFILGFNSAWANNTETLNYSYNLHGQLTGINKDYALKTPGKYDQLDHFFGMYLGYDNRDNIFTTQKLDGHITGILWSTLGNDAQRKYDFSYDAAGRLSAAAYTEKPKIEDNWNNSKMDFSVLGDGANSKIDYDLNGNIQHLTQRGVLAGAGAPVNIDRLSYTYQNLSNKLIKVKDNGNLGSDNGKFGDFTDGNNADADDYLYDVNGNLITDLNKGIGTGGINGNAIQYNFLDKPELIQIPGKGLLKMVYDANGNKLQQFFTPENSSTSVVTSYIKNFVYQNDNLQYINCEEGRFRVGSEPSFANNGLDGYQVVSTEALGNQVGFYDYFIRDHLGNVRTILTDEERNEYSTCTLETERASVEEPVFGKVDANGNVQSDNEVKARFPVSEIPGQSSGGGWQSNSSNYVSRIGNLAGSKVGPNVLLKVMAGDAVGVTTKAYFKNPVSSENNGVSLAGDMITSLIQSISSAGSASALHTATQLADITSSLGNSLPFNSVTDPDLNNNSGTSPKAYVSILFFDDQFNYIPAPYFNQTNIQRVESNGNGNSQELNLSNGAPKNGYAFISVSNSSDEPVYFDDFLVGIGHSPLLEENHYYPFGLKIAGISDHSMPAYSGEGHVENENLFNDKELITDGGLNWYDYGFRSYDPQIARFPQFDPLSSDYPYYTPYQYAGNEPIANVDLDGLEPVAYDKLGYGVLADVTVTAFKPKAMLPAVVGNILQFGHGFASSIVGSAWNLIKTAATIQNPQANPLETAKLVNGLKTAASMAYTINPGDPAKGLAAIYVADKYYRFVNGNWEVKGNVGGETVFDIGTLALPGAAEADAANLAAHAAETESVIAVDAAEEGSTFWRAMSNGEYSAAKEANGLTYKPGTELFVSPEESYSRDLLQKKDYDVLVKFEMKPGAVNYFNEKGVFHQTEAARSGWAGRGNLMWKSEGGIKNLGIQQNTHLFNPWIKSFTIVP